MSELFNFQPTLDTLIALAAGATCLILSYLMLFFRRKTKRDKIANFLLRDFLMIFGLGVAFPLSYVVFAKGWALGQIGLTLHDWYLALAANIGLAAFITLSFWKESPKKIKMFKFAPHAKSIFYIMVAGVFEVIFFYAFLRYYFELAFGAVFAIVLASAFYSLHHIGFESQLWRSPRKELAKLFFVGIMFATVFRIFNSALAIYPFFWGVGAVYDVLIEKGARGLPWKNAAISSLLMIAFLTFLSLHIW
ncbi:MAG: hypothetical protein QMD00_03510 [Hadesarchaea archaeon]|nr:hypothetical protein [Hadesarchaea archaeon]